jgi:hypothetical protein
MKIKYIIIFIVLLIVGNFFRLFIEDKNKPNVEISKEVNYKKEKAKENSDLTKKKKKFDVNSVEYADLLKLGFSKSKADNIIKFRDETGIILDIEDMKNVERFGKSGLEISKKYLFVDKEKIKNPKENYGKEIAKYNINKCGEKELKRIGFTAKEIKKILLELENGSIRSNLDLEKIIGSKRYSEIENKIKFID